MAQCLNEQHNSYRDYTGMDITQKMIAAHTMVEPAASKDRGYRGKYCNEKIVSDLRCPQA